MRNLLDITTENLERNLGHLLAILDDAGAIAASDHADTGATAGKAVATLFFENSTRTRLSFELAAKRLHMHTINMDVDRSSAEKGESLRDTVRTVDAMGMHAICIRHTDDGAAALAADAAHAAILNAGTGTTAHPTQALLDVLTIARERRPDAPIDADLLKGLRIAVIGDIEHSRVAASLVPFATGLGAEVTLVGPESMLDPSAAARLGASAAVHDLEAGVRPGGDPVDIVYTLRIQFERHLDDLADRAQTIADYATAFGLSAERFNQLTPDAHLMHPGPVNRGVELDDSALDMPCCLVQQQVTNGVYVRMAALRALTANLPARP